MSAIKKKALPKREGLGKSSFVRIPGFLAGKQLERARKFVTSRPVQNMMDQGALFDHNSKDTSRSSKVAWIERHEEEGEPCVPPWLDAKLRAAAKLGHEVYGDSVAKVGIDKNGNWTPRFEVCVATRRSSGIACQRICRMVARAAQPRRSH